MIIQYKITQRKSVLAIFSSFLMRHDYIVPESEIFAEHARGQQITTTRRGTKFSYGKVPLYIIY